MHQKGSPGVKSEVILADGQQFSSLSSFAAACNISYPTLWRRIWQKGQNPNDIAREKGVLRTIAAE